MGLSTDRLRPVARPGLAIVLLVIGIPSGLAGAAEEVPVDLAGYRPDCGVAIRHEGQRLSIAWPMAEGEYGRMVLDLRPGGPLIESLGIGKDAAGEAVTVLKGVEPVTYVTVGSREAPPGRPPEMSVFNVFFDSPAKRPHESYRARLDLRRARVTSRGHRATVALGELSAGPFKGELHVSVYEGARLVHVEAVVSTSQERRAFLYDAGLASESPTWRRFGWIDTEGRFRREDAGAGAADRPRTVRHRAIVAEADGGSLACFPPPHQFFFPRDLTENLQSAWFGRGHRGLDDRPGFGVRQSETGGGNFVPWFNAPPGTEQHLGVFYLLSRGDAEAALREVLRFTHGDRFPDLPGHRTFTSHWHMATAVAAMQEQAKGASRTTPDFVRMFKDMGVDIVHLAEFHGDGHPQDPGPLRLPEMEAMFAECRRLSDDELLLLPGEEANVYLGLNEPGRHPGHWLYLFPRPVYWTMRRGSDEPFVEEHARYGTVYHVGSRADMVRLLEREHGLAWTAHPRIKASSWTPDIYRNEDFYRADFWLGAAWKAMPADLSRPRLGGRALDLLDDMANWGGRKYLLGEVDVFKLDHTHELYGHMNVNYVRLDRLPRFDDGWRPVLDALRAGRFFVTTGEVLLRDFTVGGKGSGETLASAADARPEVRLDLEWTFPLQFVEVISGDGTRVSRERIDLAEMGPFGRRTLTLLPDLRGRKWVRVEAWDIAGDGAFTEPVWLEGATGRPPG
jgi:hypothetical protein